MDGMWPPKNFVIGMVLAIFIIAAGTIGYQSIEGWGSWIRFIGQKN